MDLQDGQDAGFYAVILYIHVNLKVKFMKTSFWRKPATFTLV